jgi:hypothetical protein
VTALFGRAAELARLRRWLAGAVEGLPQVVGCSGEAGSARRGCWRRSRMRRNPWAQVRWARSLAPASAPPHWLWEQLFRLDAVASLPLRLPGCLRSARSAPAFHPVAQGETTDPRSAGSASLKLLFQKPADELAMASAREGRSSSSLADMCGPRTLPVKRVLRFQHSLSPNDATM